MINTSGTYFIIGFAVFTIAVLFLINLLAGKISRQQIGASKFFLLLEKQFHLPDLVVFTLLFLGVLQLSVVLLGLQTINNLSGSIRITILIAGVVVVLRAQTLFTDLTVRKIGLGSYLGSEEKPKDLNAKIGFYLAYIIFAVVLLVGLAWLLPGFLESWTSPVVDTMSMIGIQTMSVFGGI